MPNNAKCVATFLVFVSVACVTAATPQVPSIDGNKTISEADCTTNKLGSAIPISAIGEPVSGISLSAPRWIAASGNTPAYCAVDGTMSPVDRSASAKPILFRVALPASWNRRAAQMGGVEEQFP